MTNHYNETLPLVDQNKNNTILINLMDCSRKFGVINNC
jgi:hypothetical protein